MAQPAEGNVSIEVEAENGLPPETIIPAQKIDRDQDGIDTTWQEIWIGRHDRVLQNGTHVTKSLTRIMV